MVQRHLLINLSKICKTQIQQPPDIKKVFATQENLAVVQQEVKRFRTLPDKIKTGQLAMRDIEIAISVSDIQGKYVL